MILRSTAVPRSRAPARPMPGPKSTCRAGWVEYDPTNGVIAGENLIRVAVTRDAAQAVPIAGTFSGDPSHYLGMQVEVLVSAEAR